MCHFYPIPYVIINLKEEKRMEEIRSKIYTSAMQKYGKIIPKEISERIEAELNVLQRDTELMCRFVTCSHLIERIKNETSAYYTECDIFTYSSLVAYLLGISMVDPLPPYYYCSECGHFEFIVGQSCCLDLPEKICKKCRTLMKKGGYRITPMILITERSERIRISIVTSEKILSAGALEAEFAPMTGIDITYRGGITVLDSLEKRTGVDSTNMITDEEAQKNYLEIIRKKDIIGIPGIYDSHRLCPVMSCVDISTFSDIIKMNEFSWNHGTWNNYTCKSVKEGIPFSEIISCFDDLFFSFTDKGINANEALRITKGVGLCRDLNEKDSYALQKKGIPEWIIDSIREIFCLTSKSYSCTILLIQLRLAYFKTYYPLEFYCEWLNLYTEDFRNELSDCGIENVCERVSFLLDKGENVPGVLLIYKDLLEKGYWIDEIYYVKVENYINKVSFDIDKKKKRIIMKLEG